MNGLIYLSATVCLGEHAAHTQAHTQHPTAGWYQNTSADYLYYPNESFQLVNVKLEVHAVCQPGADNVHRAGVPLLQERQDFSSDHAGAACCALAVRGCTQRTVSTNPSR